MTLVAGGFTGFFGKKKSCKDMCYPLGLVNPPRYKAHQKCSNRFPRCSRGFGAGGGGGGGGGDGARQVVGQQSPGPSPPVQPVQPVKPAELVKPSAPPAYDASKLQAEISELKIKVRAVST